MDDARRTLDDAVRERRPCRLSRPGGDWAPGVLVRVEQASPQSGPAGVVLSVPGHGLRGGEEVRLWLDEGGRPTFFEASVLRTNVPVPDRSANGVLIGFLAPARAPSTPVAVSGTEAVVPADAPSPVAELVLPTGAPVSLLQAPFELLDVGPDRVDFQVPRAFTVVFPENGVLRLRVGASAGEVVEVRGRVGRVVSGETHHVYAVAIEGVQRQDVHQRAVAALRTTLGR